MATDWYCRIAGAELGPLSSQQLRALAADGRLRVDDEVCQGPEGKWVPASRVKGLLKGPGGELLVARPLAQTRESAVEKPAAARDQRAATGSLPKAKAAPRPPQIPQAMVPVAKVASVPSSQAVPSPFAFKEPEADRGKPSGAKSGTLSPADAAKRRRKQRMRLLIGSLAALGALAALAVGIWLFRDRATPETASTDKPSPVARIEEGLLGALDLEPDDLLDGPSRLSETPAEAGATDSWLDASKETATVGPVQVRVVSVQVDKPRLLRGTGRAAAPTEDFLIVTVEVTNTDPAKKVVHAGWGGRTPAAQRVALVDNHGNPYKARTFTGGTVEGQQSDTSLYAAEPVRDVLVFERPVDAAKYLRLSLPASAFGQSGSLRFQIPKQMIGAEPNMQVAEAAPAPSASREEQEPDDTGGEVYALEATEKAVQQAIGMDPDRPLSDFEKLKRDNPGLFPDQE